MDSKNQKRNWPLYTQQQLSRDIIRSPKIVRRGIAAKWIVPIVQGGRGRASIFSPTSIDIFVERLEREKPPLLPCEIKKKEASCV